MEQPINLQHCQKWKKTENDLFTCRANMSYSNWWTTIRCFSMTWCTFCDGGQLQNANSLFRTVRADVQIVEDFSPRAARFTYLHEKYLLYYSSYSVTDDFVSDASSPKNSEHLSRCLLSLVRQRRITGVRMWKESGPLSIRHFKRRPKRFESKGLPWRRWKQD